MVELEALVGLLIRQVENPRVRGERLKSEPVNAHLWDREDTSVYLFEQFVYLERAGHTGKEKGSCAHLKAVQGAGSSAAIRCLDLNSHDCLPCGAIHS